MGKSIRSELLRIAKAAEPIARKLRQIETGLPRPVAFSHVVESAHAFLAAVIVHKIDKTIWILCPSVRSQETLYESLLNWQPGALFLNEAEFVAIEKVLPHTAIAAERLALLSTIDSEPGPHLIVATTPVLIKPPERIALQSARVQLRRDRSKRQLRPTF